MASLKDKAVRRLTNIRVFHVSLVDRPANKQEFLVQKNKGVAAMEEVLKEIKKALGALTERIDGLEAINKRLADGAEMIEIEKAGARLSKSTLATIRGTIKALQKLLGEGGGTESDEVTEKVLSLDEAMAAIEKGMAVATETDKGVENKAGLEEVIKGMVKAALVEANSITQKD